MAITTVQGSSQAAQTPQDIDNLKKEAYRLEQSSNPADRAKGHQMLMQLVVAQYDSRLDPPDHTFDAKGTPFDPQTAGNVHSDDGAVAAQGVIHDAYRPSDVAEILSTHKNDPVFLQQFFGTLGPDRTALIFRSLTDGHQEPGVSAQDEAQERQDAANALSTMVSNQVFNQKDMDRLVGQLANDPLTKSNFSFAKDVLGKASPEVNEMFYQSAMNYALNHADTPSGKAMAIYAAQALSQTPSPYAMNALNQLQKQGKLAPFVQAAMEGQAQYGSPSPFDGLSHLMTDVTASDIGGEGSAPLLSSADAQAIEVTMFNSATSTMHDDTAVKSFYQNSGNFKDALSSVFTTDYDAIVKSNTAQNKHNGKPNYDLSTTGIERFQEFFGDVFSPPLGSNEPSTAQFFASKVNDFVNDANNLTDDQFKSKYGGLDKAEYASLMGEQAGLFSVALSKTLSSIKDAAAEDRQQLQDTIDLVVSVGEAGGGAIGPVSGIGAALIGEALKLKVVSQAGGNPDDAVRAFVQDLKHRGIVIGNYDAGGLNDTLTNIDDDNAREHFGQAATWVGANGNPDATH